MWCVCVHVCVAHLSVIHIYAHICTHEFIHAHIHTWYNTALPNVKVSDTSFKEGHVSTFQLWQVCANLYTLSKRCGKGLHADFTCIVSNTCSPTT